MALERTDLTIELPAVIAAAGRGQYRSASPSAKFIGKRFAAGCALLSNLPADQAFNVAATTGWSPSRPYTL
jgi:hypothetical protein